jgi:hypothetical protein
MSRRKHISPNMHRALQNAKAGVYMGPGTRQVMKKGGCTSMMRLPKRRKGGGCGCGK